MINNDLLVEGSLDEAMLEDPVMDMVDRSIEADEEAEEDILRGGRLADSDLIDIIEREDPVELAANL